VSARRALWSLVVLALQAGLGAPLPSAPYLAALLRPTATALAAIWSGAATPETALNAAQQAAQANLRQLRPRAAVGTG
jgi:maltose-binding protein MalE